MGKTYKKPAPFKRPSITLGEKKRTWEVISPSKLSPGDIIPERGEIREVDHSVPNLVVATFVSGQRVGYDLDADPTAIVFAFTHA